MTYFNTNKQTGSTLKESQVKAQTQDEKILSYFKRYHFIHHTPEEVHERVFKDTVPLTSTRRALSNLTKSGHLVKCDKMRKGKYGKQIHTWRLK